MSGHKWIWVDMEQHQPILVPERLPELGIYPEEGNLKAHVIRCGKRYVLEKKDRLTIAYRSKMTDVNEEKRHHNWPHKNDAKFYIKASLVFTFRF